MEDHLYDQLSKFNKNIPNKFKEQWGSALLFLEGSCDMGKQKYDEVQIYQQL